MTKPAVVLVCMVTWAAGALAAEKPRIYISDSKSWAIAGGGGGTAGGFGEAAGGGARPQTAEIIKTFNQRCPQVMVNDKRQMADYIVLLDHEGGKGWYRRDNKVAVFNRAGDSIMSESTRLLGNSVQDACAAIVRDWSAHPVATPASISTTAARGPAPAAAKVSVTSTPDRADIEVDGNYVGSTPSLLDLKTGSHTMVIKKSGYKPWERKLLVEGAHVNIAAELEKE